MAAVPLHSPNPRPDYIQKNDLLQDVIWGLTCMLQRTLRRCGSACQLTVACAVALGVSPFLASFEADAQGLLAQGAGLLREGKAAEAVALFTRAADADVTGLGFFTRTAGACPGIRRNL